MGASGGTGLGNHAILKKIDTLREINIGAVVPLPQLIVVGDQSSGKSSVLESLTSFSFPHAAGLCTRYATQITCSRESTSKVSISIIPRPDADDVTKARLQTFRRQLDSMDNDKLAEIFTEANVAMGIRTGDEDTFDLPAFSEDILKIEIAGPEQSHLTVIDVPGIFRVPTPGLTKQSDVDLIRNMVKGYMKNSRTIILAVIPCNVDIATQEILKLAEEADQDGSRTMGVLTKPDLATERVTQDNVVDLAKGKRSNLRLGYCVVKNRSGDDTTSTAEERIASEKAFFAGPPWSDISDRCGVESLKARLVRLLFQISKRELPNVKSDIARRKRECEDLLEAMGPARADDSTQRQFLVKIANQMQDITKSALNGYYADEDIFRSTDQFKLITKILRLNDVFADVFREKGHYQCFRAPEPVPEEDAEEDASVQGGIDLQMPLIDEYSELLDIIEAEYECPEPLEGPMTPTIRKIYESNRGPDLGTFNGVTLSFAFDAATVKWESLAIAHISKAIVVVHDYIYKLLDHLCPDKSVRDQLWDFLRDQLCGQYRHAMEHVRFLLTIERSNLPVTLSHYYDRAVSAKRQQRSAQALRCHAVSIPQMSETEKYVTMSQVEKHGWDKNGVQQRCEDILDSLESYYKVALERFVDTVCQQVVFHMLLISPDSPVKSMHSDLVMQLTPDQLELIAGEDSMSRHQRQVLNRELKSLEKAIKVLQI